jgi:hypothetical protein
VGELLGYFCANVWGRYDNSMSAVNKGSPIYAIFSFVEKRGTFVEDSFSQRLLYLCLQPKRERSIHVTPASTPYCKDAAIAPL